MILQLPVRYWPKCPPPDVPLSEYDEKSLQDGELEMDFAVEATAFMLVDCWNLSKDGPPIVPGMSKYWDYNFIAGGASWLERAEAIVTERILPCLRRARELGMLVVHGPSSYIANNYKQCQELSRTVVEPPSPVPRAWPPADFVAERWPQFMSLRYGVDCEAHWNQLRPAMDIASALRPTEEEVVFSTLAQLDHVLTERRILNVIFVGFAANACLLQKPGAVADLSGCGYQIVVLRDCSTAIEAPWSVDSLAATRATMDYVEMCYGYTATGEDFLRASAH